MAFTEDNRIWPLLVELLDCYKSELTKRDLDDACTVTLSPGLAVDMSSEEDYAWVRLASIFPSSQFPTQDFNTVSCGSPYAAIAEIGMARCIEVPELTIIGELDNAEYVRKQMADWAAMRAAVECCFNKAKVGADGLLVRVSEYQPFGPEGGKFGGIMRVAFAPE